ncbi:MULTISPECIES: DUF86 domain-containing protein [Halomonas]|uniref:HepT-like ribonuclease domain-containing protein n=1 Tax=Halomonas TaxID=2745 RepID=UPI001C93B786|nr:MULTISPECIES: DUF86 domain-containing protein [Halomonas]MBY6207404.1 DUF86 domain-containing protein [Halomonas sp. DP3Y7-2]MBY6228213.1 DUF86 domain-containing protein [Halomonas sp. DP3Y7-1]MCA0916279.1 DUF86 domain-containing protein [Halomonas denitrificans]
MSKGARPREWRFYLEDMAAFTRKVLKYTAGVSEAEFVNDELLFDATLRNLELIGEAATHVPPDIRLRFPDIPWRMVIATRNRLIHAYLGIDTHTVWSIISTDLPALLRAIEAMQRHLDEKKP